MDQKATNTFDTVLRRILTVGIDGFPKLGFKGASEVAEEHLKKNDPERAINTVVRQHVALASASGFATGVGGFATMAVALPADVVAFYTLATRMVATIARIRGHNTDDEEVRTGILLALLGSTAANVARDFGITLGVAFATSALKKLPMRVLNEINRRVGFRLFTKFGTTGLGKMAKAVPFIGGAVGASMNAATLLLIATAAKMIFAAVEDHDAQTSTDTEPGRAGSATDWEPDSMTS